MLQRKNKDGCSSSLNLHLPGTQYFFTVAGRTQISCIYTHGVGWSNHLLLVSTRSPHFPLKFPVYSLTTKAGPQVWPMDGCHILPASYLYLGSFPSSLSWVLITLNKARESDFIHGRTQSWRTSIQLWTWGQMITQLLLRSCLRNRGFSSSQDPLFCCWMVLAKDTAGSKADHIPDLTKLTPGRTKGSSLVPFAISSWCWTTRSSIHSSSIVTHPIHSNIKKKILCEIN